MHNRAEDCWFVLCPQGVAQGWSGSGWHWRTVHCTSLAPWAARMGRKHHSSQSSGRGHCTTSDTGGAQGEVEQTACGGTTVRCGSAERHNQLSAADTDAFVFRVPRISEKKKKQAGHLRTSKNCGTRRRCQISTPLQQRSRSMQGESGNNRVLVAGAPSCHAWHGLARAHPAASLETYADQPPSLETSRPGGLTHRTVACSARQAARASAIQNSVFHRSWSSPVCRAAGHAAQRAVLKAAHGQQHTCNCCSSTVVAHAPPAGCAHLSKVERRVELLHRLGDILSCLVRHCCGTCKQARKADQQRRS